MLAAATVTAFGVPEADAAKVRKKPPVRPLSPPAAVMDSGVEGDTVEEDAETRTVTPSVPMADPTPAIPYPASGVMCLYGEQDDSEPHKRRCMAPEQLNPPRLIVVNSRPLAEKLGMLDHTKGLSAPDGGVLEPSEEDLPEPEAPFKARVVRVSFENGAVGGALRNLRARTDEMGKCVEENGGLRSESARLKLLFFVRDNQKASGMIVASARNVPVPIVRCIRKVIEDGTVGRPSTNAVGVTLLIELRNAETK